MKFLTKQEQLFLGVVLGLLLLGLAVKWYRAAHPAAVAANATLNNLKSDAGNQF